MMILQCLLKRSSLWRKLQYPEDFSRATEYMHLWAQLDFPSFLPSFPALGNVHFHHAHTDDTSHYCISLGSSCNFSVKLTTAVNPSGHSGTYG